MNNKMRPALIGGVALGLLSAIPFVSALNICCCAWVLMGGALAAHLYIKESPQPVTSGEGAQLGLIAGAIGAVIYVIISVPVGLLFSDVANGMVLKIFQSVNPQMAEEMQKQIALQQAMPLSAKLPQILGFSLLSAVVIVIFATLGGLLGVVLFEKRKGAGGGSLSAPPPPPTPGFGGPPATPGFGGPQPPPPPPPAQPPADNG